MMSKFVYALDKDLNGVVLNAEKILYIIPTTDGGSQIYFEECLFYVKISPIHLFKELTEKTVKKKEL